MLLELAPQKIKDRFELLKTNPENPVWHPEGSTYDHIKIVTERLIITGDIDLIMSGFFHDLYKLETTKTNPKTGHPSAFGHEVGSARLVLEPDNQEFIKKMGADVDIVHGIVKNHMRIKQINEMRNIKQNELKELVYFDKLEIFTRADTMLSEFNF